MKKIYSILILILLVGCVAVPALAPTNSFGQSLVALPEEGRVLIFALVTAGLAYLLGLVNMGQYSQALAAVIAPILVTFVESFLGTIPSAFDNIILTIIHLLVLFLAGSIGATVFFKRAKTPARLLEG